MLVVHIKMHGTDWMFVDVGECGITFHIVGREVATHGIGILWSVHVYILL
jgi:hypothetical protein